MLFRRSFFTAAVASVAGLFSGRKASGQAPSELEALKARVEKLERMHRR